MVDSTPSSTMSNERATADSPRQRDTRRAMLQSIGGRPGFRWLLVSYFLVASLVPGQERCWRNGEDIGSVPAG